MFRVELLRLSIPLDLLKLLIDSVLLYIWLLFVNALKLDVLAEALLSFRVSIVMSAICLISILLPS